MPAQTIILHLDGITAADYLAHVLDPEPAALDLGLRSVTFDAEPFGDTITATLDWDRPVPPVAVAAAAAGMPLTADVRAVVSGVPQRTPAQAAAVALCPAA